MNKNVFIIEDDTNIASGLQVQFSIAGFNAETNQGEEDIEDLINSIKKFNADVVILDLILPKFDGFEIIKSIRADKEIADIFIFIFTDISDGDSRARGIQAGANQYFIKEDFSIEEFSSKVEKIIENKEALTGESNHTIA